MGKFIWKLNCPTIASSRNKDCISKKHNLVYLQVKSTRRQETHLWNNCGWNTTAKIKIHCTRITVKWNLGNFPSYVTTPTADITTSIIIFNSALLTKNEKSVCSNIANFYLKNPMNINEYVKLPLEIIPAGFIKQ